jgi:histidinol dehydrogenase
MISVPQIVATIIEEVRREGDVAIRRIGQKLGDQPFAELSQSDITAACTRLSKDRKDTIDFAAKNIRKFAEATAASINREVIVEYDEYSAGMRFAPVGRVACYVPGGRFPLASTALMTTIPADVAGVSEIYLLGPELTDEIIYAGTVGGATRFFQVGGAQAVAAAAIGTQTVPKADMVVGPGNAFVAEAKRQLIGTVGIDMLAGPSEIAIIADENADPNLVVCDLLSQAEHDPDAICYLFTTSAKLGKAIERVLPARVSAMKDRLPDFINESVAKIRIRELSSLKDCADASNEVAPEHLLLHLDSPDAVIPLLRNYGALFIGKNATVPYGDYCAGPNHTLPTGGTARFSGGLTPLTFLRTQTWLTVSQPAKVLSEYTQRFAEIEGLFAHSDAAGARSKETIAQTTMPIKNGLNSPS